jgi:tRNA pseudouridine55 synthase
MDDGYPTKKCVFCQTFMTGMRDEGWGMKDNHGFPATLSVMNPPHPPFFIPHPCPDGFLLIDKPAGITSHDVVDAVRKIAKTRRVGHAGTLDPFATGLLIVGIGNATKKLGDLAGLEKTYEAAARLGATSTTDDPEGSISHSAFCIADSDQKQCEMRPAINDIERAFDQFRGGYVQTAPAFSAKKVDGKKLYELARKGETGDMELPKKRVAIHELKILSYDWPELTFRARCSSGTYVRALARDMGEALGTGAYLTALRRTKIGSYDIKDAISLKELAVDIMKKRLLPL